MAILEIKGLRKSFGGVMAVAGMDLEVEDGHIDSIIGPNVTKAGSFSRDRILPIFLPRK